MTSGILRSRTASRIERFLARENPSSTLTSPAPFPSTSANPFAPTKEERGNSWRAPKYSLRTQTLLRKEAMLFGLPDDVLPPPYYPDPSKKATSTLSSPPRASTSAATSTPSLSRSRNDDSRRREGTLEPTRVLPRTSVLEQVPIEKKGPYAGRQGPAFKGKMWERNYEQRQGELKAAAAQREAKIAAHRNAEAEWRQKSKSKLPY